MIIAFTSHRPLKLGGYILPNPTYLYVCREIEKALREFKPEKIITGMALGGDQYAAMIAHKLGIPFMAAIPFERQESKWPETSQKTYRLLRKLASEEVIVSAGGYSADKMQARNKFMVDHCDKLIAVYNSDPNGGTANCVKYAKSINKDIFIIDPRKA
jgi:uncharacterized phage-like protein YoqJ